MSTLRGRSIARLVGVAVVLFGVLTIQAPSNATSTQTGAGPTSDELVVRLGGLSDELTQVDASLAATTSDLSAAIDEVATATKSYTETVRNRDTAVAKLSRYSISAYISGDVVQADLMALFQRPGVGLDAEERHALIAGVHNELIAEARNALADYERASTILDQGEASVRDTQVRLDALAARQVSLRAEIESTQLAVDQAKLAEKIAADRARSEAAALATAEARARRIDLRPGMRRPDSAHSGVVPARSVSAELTARLIDEIPPTALDAYWRATSLVNASRPECAIDWALIAAIGNTETGHGTYGGTVIAPDGSTSPTILGIPLDGSAGIVSIRDTDGGKLDGDTEFDRAVGPMQFIPSTWRAFAADGNGDGIEDPHNVYDAAVATGNYLCSSGRGALSISENASRAVYAYNQSVQYNIVVLNLADHYRRVLDPNLPPATTPPTVPVNPGSLPPSASPSIPPPTVATSSTSTSTPATTSTTTAP